MERKAYADKLGVSRERMRQIEQTALRELRAKKEIQEYRQEFSYHHVGIQTYNSTWTSTTELAVLRLEKIQQEIQQMEREMMNRFIEEEKQERGNVHAGHSNRILSIGEE